MGSQMRAGRCGAIPPGLHQRPVRRQGAHHERRGLLRQQGIERRSVGRDLAHGPFAHGPFSHGERGFSHARAAP
jgi:hypothetical protein